MLRSLTLASQLRFAPSATNKITYFERSSEHRLATATPPPGSRGLLAGLNVLLYAGVFCSMKHLDVVSKVSTSHGSIRCSYSNGMEL